MQIIKFQEPVPGTSKGVRPRGLTPLSLLVVLALTGCAAFSRDGIVRGKIRLDSNINGTRTLPYHLVPSLSRDPKTRVPLLMVLHGAGGNGEEYLASWKEEALRRGWMVVAPTMAHHYRKNFESLKGFYDLIEKISLDYPVDSERIFLAGISAGGLIGSWVMDENPAFWRGVILIASPGFNPGTERLAKERFPPLFFIHGEKDKVFPHKRIEEHVNTLKNQGLEVTFLSDPQASHDQKPEWTPLVFDWIEKNTSPSDRSSV